MEYLGYIVAAMLIPSAIGFAIIMRYRDGRKVKNISIAPWKVNVEFEENDNG